MQKPLVSSRLTIVFITGKMLAAIALLFALTLPLTTCTVGRTVQEHHVELTVDNIGTILCFVWPVPLLLARASSARARASLWPFIVEWILAVVALGWLTFQVLVTGAFSLGEIKPASGYELASSSLAGYFALSLLEGVLVVFDRRAKKSNALAAAIP